mgnify:CR=1 FL=1
MNISGNMLERRKKGDHATGLRMGHANGLILCLAHPNLCSEDGVPRLEGMYISEFLIRGGFCLLPKPHQDGSPRSQFLSPCASIEY